MSDRRNDPTDAKPDVPEKIGPYQVKGSLGKGGMGEVYRGYDDRLARSVALKRVLTTEADSTKFRRRLRREARTVAQLNHSSIVQVYDWVETKEFDWLVMELVDGKPLSDLAHEGRLPMDRVVEIAIGIADGLAAAHRAGIVHRDLKLSNVMVSKDGVKILDFGIAKPTKAGDIGQTEITREGAVVGTASSMSPEQAQGLTIDHRSDLFSFGTLLYELLTAESPFRGHDMLQTILRIYSVQQKPAIELNPDVPLRLSRLIDFLLEKEPDNRPPDAGVVADELRGIASDLRGGDSQTGLRRPLFSTASLEATLAGGGPTPMPATKTGESSTSGPLPSKHRTGSPKVDTHSKSAERPYASITRTAVGTGTFLDPAANTVRSWIGIAAVALLAAVIGWGVYQFQGKDAEESPVSTDVDVPASAQTLQANRIVVLPFTNRTTREEFDSLGLIVSDWLTQGLSLSRQIEVVPSDLAVRAANFAAAQTEEDSARSVLELVADDTKARTVVSGAYYLRPGELIFRGQITDVAEGRVIAALEPLSTSTDDPIGFLEDFEQSVRAKVATNFDPQLATLGDLANTPPTYDAYEAYVRGMERFRLFDFPSAIEEFESAAELAPNFAMPRLMAATSYLNLAQFNSAASLLEEVHSQRDQLAPLDRLFLESLQADLAGDYARAAKVAGQAASLAPLSPWAQTRGLESLRANLPHQALKALEPLDPESGILRGWTPHFEVLTLAFHLTGDHDGELESARYGRELHPQSLICHTAEARALAALGRTEEAEALFAEIEHFSQELNFSPGLAMAIVVSELQVHGQSQASREAAERLVAWYERGLSGQPFPPSERHIHSTMLLVLGRADEALVIARTLIDENPDSPDLIEYVGLLGVAAAAAGDLATSDAQLSALSETDQTHLYGRDSYWQAAIHAWRGNQEKAIELFRQAASDGHPFIWPRMHPHFDPIWTPLRDSPSFEDAIRPRG